jgi:hypothetical protein
MARRRRADGSWVFETNEVEPSQVVGLSVVKASWEAQRCCLVLEMSDGRRYEVSAYEPMLLQAKDTALSTEDSELE